MKPVVLCFSGLDPTGGAGIQADIEAIAAQGGHAASIITAVTVQDSHNVKSFQTLAPSLITAQAHAILDDMAVAAIKIGMLGSVEVATAIATIIQTRPSIPVIFDPVLAAGGGTDLAGDILVDTIKTSILPLCRLITPNIPEAERLCAQSTPSSAALLNLGADAVLLTGTHADTDQVEHQLIDSAQPPQRFDYPRLPHNYHGSGCTLSASIAALIATGLPLSDAVQQALDYTYRTLQQAQALGQGQLFPNRFPVSQPSPTS